MLKRNSSLDTGIFCFKICRHVSYIRDSLVQSEVYIYTYIYDMYIVYTSKELEVISACIKVVFLNVFANIM